MGDAIPRSSEWPRCGTFEAMAEPYSIVRIPEIEPISVAGVHWKPLRRTLGIDAFGINAYVGADAGDLVVEKHTEMTYGHQEAYIVITGHARFFLDDEEIDAPNGTVVFVRDTAVRRHAIAVAAGTTVLAIGGVPGVHTPSSWEWTFAAEQYRASEDYNAAIALLHDGLEQFPEDGSIHYAIACWQALGAQTGEAIASLTTAFELDPKSAEWAKNDADLDSIRGLPGSPV